MFTPQEQAFIRRIRVQVRAGNADLLPKAELQQVIDLAARAGYPMTDEQLTDAQNQGYNVKNVLAIAAPV